MSAAEIEEAAARWLARADEPGWTGADQAELDAWLGEAMAHRVAFLRLRSVWRRADRLAALGPGVARRAPRPFAAPWRLAAAIAAAAVLGAGVFALAPDLGRKSYVTEVGERATVPLRDGSRVELNTDTRVRATVDDARRAVWLDKGEAYFDVAHDGRPFVVYAGRQKITVLGTRFSVRRRADGIDVAVADGKVRVEPVAQTPQAKPAIVTRGDMVVARGPSLLVAARSVEKVENDLSWRHGVLVFDRSTLAEAVAEFNRYNRKKLVIEDEKTGALRIGGNFEAANVEAFGRLLREAFGLDVEDKGDRIVISG